MIIELEHEKKGGVSVVNYPDDSTTVIKDVVPKTELNWVGKTYTLTEWNKERKFLHYKQVTNTMQKVG